MKTERFKIIIMMYFGALLLMTVSAFRPEMYEINGVLLNVQDRMAAGFILGMCAEGCLFIMLMTCGVLMGKLD